MGRSMKQTKAKAKKQQIKVNIEYPIGARYQAELPPTIVSDAEYREMSSVGRKLWSAEQQEESDVTGRGRVKNCSSCEIPGSVECKKKHIGSKKLQLQRELGPAYWMQKFDEMGEEEASKLWSTQEESKFHSLVRTHAGSSGQTLMNSAVDHIPSQTRKTILGYYWNVHVPRRIAASGAHTDDESEDIVRRPPRGSRKRQQR